MPGKGVRIEKGEPVERMTSEGPLDQNLSVNIDDKEKNLVFLDSVTDENDLFARCPCTGEIDGDKAVEGKSLKQVLEQMPYLLRNLYLNSAGGGLAEYGSGAVTDKFAVSDAKWIDNVQDLIWKSALLAQMQAKGNAIANFLNDPSLANFSGKMSEEDRKLVAQRARQLAAELQDAALNEMVGDVDGAAVRMKDSVRKSKERLLRYVVTQEDAIKAGGLTESEVNELFEEA